MKSDRRKLADKYREDVKQNGTGFTFINFTEQIEPNDTSRILMLGNSSKAWERYINVCEDGKLRLYSFDLDTLQKYNWKEVLEKELYLKKVEVSVEDLDKQDWLVQF